MLRSFMLLFLGLLMTGCVTVTTPPTTQPVVNYQQAQLALLGEELGATALFDAVQSKLPNTPAAVAAFDAAKAQVAANFAAYQNAIDTQNAAALAPTQQNIQAFFNSVAVQSLVAAAGVEINEFITFPATPAPTTQP